MSCDVLCGMQWIWIGDGIGTVPQSHGYILVLHIGNGQIHVSSFMTDEPCLMFGKHFFI